MEYSRIPAYFSYKRLKRIEKPAELRVLQIPNFETVKSAALLIVSMPLYARKSAYLFHRIYFITHLDPFCFAFPSLSRVITGVILRHCEAEKMFFQCSSHTLAPARIIFRLFMSLWEYGITRLCRAGSSWRKDYLPN